MKNEFCIPRALLATALMTLTLAGCDSNTTSTTVKLPTSTPGAIKLHDPGVRLSESAVGAALTGLDANYQKLFKAGLEEFNKQENVSDDGLGPTFNFNSCGGCHAYPDVGGSSPGPTKNNLKAINPQYIFWQTNLSKTNKIPSFIAGSDPENPGLTPMREARFVHLETDHTILDGGVHALFTIEGLPGAETCTGLPQPNFEKAVAEQNIIFRIPTPVFGSGLIEQIPDTAIEENRQHEASQKQTFGISGRSNITLSGHTRTALANRNGNDGTIARFGWKAQNKSLLVFAGEAYNVEMGVSNELFPTERNETSACQTMNTPNDRTHPEKSDPMDVLSDIEKFAAYMRLLAPPTPSTSQPGGSASIEKGRNLFKAVGCAYCHTPQFTTGKSDIPQLDRKPVNLYSDLLIHNMGPKLADGVTQGQASGDEFRTAPLWGLGQRIWFLHDGRTSDLIQAIDEHHSSDEGQNNSEANYSVEKYNQLTTESKQDLLNFLRSL
ncbi:di-heme oxidoredictase family protein [Methylomonas sp. AM2-LC]|uniref:di-heme oxidoredictase family protein n=1 Tax=Methylomonas sp. AM2-LC TaxID=3153301 RepID=UPI003263634E